MDKPDSDNTCRDARRESDSRPTIGGNGNHSYSRNSSYQRNNANTVITKIEEAIMVKLDMNDLSSSSNTIRLVDMGCAVGPNTFLIMGKVVEFIQNKHKSQCADSALPEFQVFFNDQTSNDFNTLFRSLPPRSPYFPAAVPGSFYDRLFPTSSLHFIHSSYALHWLSGVPEKVKNKGRIHYSNAPGEVFKAYSSQFAIDMRNFLTRRAEELVAGGLIVIIISATSVNVPFSLLPSGIIYDCMGVVLMEMSKEGLIDEREVDSFNLPFYSTTPEEMEELVEKTGKFSIERMELSDPTSWMKGSVDVSIWIRHVRAATEATFNETFGTDIVQEMFGRLAIKLEEFRGQLHAKLHEKTQLFLVLKRKNS